MRWVAVSAAIAVDRSRLHPPARRQRVDADPGRVEPPGDPPHRDAVEDDDADEEERREGDLDQRVRLR